MILEYKNDELDFEYDGTGGELVDKLGFILSSVWDACCVKLNVNAKEFIATVAAIALVYAEEPMEKDNGEIDLTRLPSKGVLQ